MVRKPGSSDPEKQRVFAIVSRQATARWLCTQIKVGTAEGLKHESSVHCDALVSLPKMLLTRYVGRADQNKIRELKYALAIAPDLEAT